MCYDRASTIVLTLSPPSRSARHRVAQLARHKGRLGVALLNVPDQTRAPSLVRRRLEASARRDPHEHSEHREHHEGQRRNREDGVDVRGDGAVVCAVARVAVALAVDAHAAVGAPIGTGEGRGAVDAPPAWVAEALAMRTLAAAGAVAGARRER